MPTDHDPQDDQPVGVPIIVAALGARCPRCGQGPLFDGYLKVAPACSHCGLKFAGADTGDGPAFFIMLPLCIITAVLALVVDNRFAPPLWLHAIIWPVFIALFVGFTLRPVKAALFALQYRHRDVENAQ